MSYIIFFLVFYFIFSSLVISGTMIGGEYKWYDYLILGVLLGWMLFPIAVGILMQKR